MTARRPANPAAASRTRLGRSLRAARLQAGLSQPEAARRSGLSERSIRGWERGERRPRDPELRIYLYALSAAHLETRCTPCP